MINVLLFIINLKNLIMEDKQTAGLIVSIIQLLISIPGLILVYYQLGRILNEFKIKPVVGKFPEPSKKPVNSDWSIRIISYDKRPIEKCSILHNNNELPWWDKIDEPDYIKFIVPGGSGNVRIPKEIQTENAEIRVMDGKKTLRKVRFKDLPIMKP